MRSTSQAALVTLALRVTLGCDGSQTPADAGWDDIMLDVPPGGYARLVPNTAFEGVSWLVVGILPTDTSVDLTGATVSVDTHADHVRIVEQACNRLRCAVVIEADEFIDPIGQPIPRPIDAENVMLRVDPVSGQWMAATLTLFPLDYSNHSTTSSPLRLKGTFLMSSFTMAPGTRLEPNTSDLTGPGRLFVTGPVVVRGTVDVSGGDADSSTAGSASLASGAGGAAAAAGAGAGAGQAGIFGGAGGGGSHGGTGTAGEDGTGTGGEAGVSYGEMYLAALLGDEPGCGGSGGGGAVGAGGGGGGGALLVASLHSITFEDTVIDVSGGDGASGTSAGGGGSGGALWLIAPVVSGAAIVDATGGSGGTGTAATGGHGGAGRIRIDAATTGAALTLEPAFSSAGPIIDRSTLELIDADGMATVTGWATPGATVRIDVILQTGYGPGTARGFTSTAGGDGTFSLAIELLPGTSTLVASQQSGGISSTGMVGNTFEVGGSAVLGTALYVASVPAVE